MSYIAYDLDALKRVPDLAESAGLTLEKAGFGLVRLWSHCWNEKTDIATRAHLRGFFGGDVEMVAEALLAFRFLEKAEEGFRVRGAERYLRIREARSAAGKASRANLAPKKKRPAKQVPSNCPTSAEQVPEQMPGKCPANARPLHRAPSTESLESKNLGAEQPAPSSDPNRAMGATPIRVDPERDRRAEKRPEEKAPTRFVTLRNALVATYERVAGGPYRFSGEKDPPAIKRLMAMPTTDEEILRRFEFALGLTGFRQATDIANFESKWNGYAQKLGADPPARGRATNADKDWTHQPELADDGGLKF